MSIPEGVFPLVWDLGVNVVKGEVASFGLVAGRLEGRTADIFPYNRYCTESKKSPSGISFMECVETVKEYRLESGVTQMELNVERRCGLRHGNAECGVELILIACASRPAQTSSIK